MIFPKSTPYADLRRQLMEMISPRVQIQVGRARRWYHVCHWCQKRATSHKAMEFDHRGLKAYDTNRLNRWQRLRVVYREWVAAGKATGAEGGVVGVGIVGACPTCNQRDGAQRKNGDVYRGTPHGRRKKRGGKGYSTHPYVTAITAHYEAEREREAAALADVPF